MSEQNAPTKNQRKKGIKSNISPSAFPSKIIIIALIMENKINKIIIATVNTLKKPTHASVISFPRFLVWVCIAAAANMQIARLFEFVLIFAYTTGFTDICFHKFSFPSSPWGLFHFACRENRITALSVSQQPVWFREAQFSGIHPNPHTGWI